MRTGPSLSSRVDHAAEEAVDVALVDGEQELFLAREVEIDGALGEAGFVGDLGDVGDPVGRAQQQPRSGIENRVMPFLLVFGLDGALADDHESTSSS